jgi:hypothetical protein
MPSTNARIALKIYRFFWLNRLLPKEPKATNQDGPNRTLGTFLCSSRMIGDTR